MKLITRAEELILLAVLRLKEEAYCVPIYDQLNRMSDKKWTMGSIYGPLYRLEQDGYLVSKMGDPSPERGGKSKRYYQLTPKGMKALREIRRLQSLSWEGLEDLAF